MNAARWNAVANALVLIVPCVGLALALVFKW